MLNDPIPSLAHTVLSERLFISLRPPNSSNGPYPTSKIQKGPVLVCGSADLSGEGVGLFASLHKAAPISRDLLEYGNQALRFTWGLSTTFETTQSAGSVRVAYTFDRRQNVLHIRADTSRLNKTGCTEVIFLNELDGSLFDRYSDANGDLVGKEIGTWEETDADYVTVSDSRHNIGLAFRSLSQSTMYRGREVAHGRLSWTGVAYVIPPRCVEFEYEITIREAK